MIAELGVKVTSDGLLLTNKELEKLGRVAPVAEDKVNKLNRSSKILTKTMRKFSSIIGLTVGVALFGVVRTLSSFESGMSKVAAVTRASASELAAMRDVAKDLGSTTEFTAAQAASGLSFLGMAGFSAAESISAIPAVLDLATASAMDLGRAADISSNIMSAFGIAATDAGSVADILAAAASRANTDVGQLGEAMKFVGPIASALDISMNDTAAAIGILSDAGLQGTMAGTGLRRVLSSLINPTDDAVDALDALGVKLSDVNPETASLVDIVDTLAKSGLEAGDALTIFGDRGGPAILALTSQSAGLKELTGELQNVEGAAKTMADVMRDNVGGDITILKSGISGLIIAIGEAGLTGGIRTVVQGLTSMVGVLSKMAPAIKIIAFVSRGVIDAIGMVASDAASLFRFFSKEVVGVAKTTDSWTDAVDSHIQAEYDLEYALLQVDGSNKDAADSALLAANANLDAARAAYDRVDAEVALARAMVATQSIEAGAARAVASTGMNFFSDEIVSQTEEDFDNATKFLVDMEAELGVRSRGLRDAFVGIDRAVTYGSGGPTIWGVTRPKVIEEISDSVLELTGSVSDLGEETETLADKFKGVLTDAVGGLQEAFQDWQDRGFKDFGSFTKSMVDVFKKMILDMILIAAKNKIMVSLGLGGATGSAGGLLGGAGSALLGGFGTAAAGTTAAVAGTGLLGGLGAVGTGLMSGGLGGAAAATGAAVSGGVAAGGMAGAGMALGAIAPWLVVGIALFSIFKKKPPYKEKDFNAIQSAIALTNTELLNTSTAGHKAATGLKEAFGGLDNMQKATDTYYSQFFTQEEQRLKSMADIDGVFAGLNMETPETASQFRSIVEAQDLMTESGRDTYAAMLQVSGAFADVYGGANDVNRAMALMSGRQGVFATLQDEIFATAAQSNGYMTKIATTREDDSEEVKVLLREIVSAVTSGAINTSRHTAKTVALLERQVWEPPA